MHRQRTSKLRTARRREGGSSLADSDPNTLLRRFNKNDGVTLQVGWVSEDKSLELGVNF